MDIAELEEETYLFVRYRCNAGTYKPSAEHKSKKDIPFASLAKSSKKKSVEKNKVEVHDKDIDSDDDDKDVIDMDVKQNYY